LITFERLRSEDHGRVAHLDLPPEQHRFSAPPSEILKDDGAYDNYAIVADGTVVGFFRIDLAYPEHMDHALPDELGVRAFSIGDAYQGRGYAKAACRAIAPMLRETYPHARSVALTVNCKNPGAYHCYRSGGFVDTGALYLGGDAGPQHVMRLPLDPSAKGLSPSDTSLIQKLTAPMMDLRSRAGRRRQIQQLRHHISRWLVRIRRTVPPGLRSVLGLLLIVGGVFGFLPILGFWMIPLGIAVMALDLRPLWRRLRG